MLNLKTVDLYCYVAVMTLDELEDSKQTDTQIEKEGRPIDGHVRDNYCYSWQHLPTQSRTPYHFESIGFWHVN